MKEQNDMKGKKEMEETNEGNEGKEGNEGREGNEGNIVDKGGALGIVISMVVNLAGVPRTSTMLSKLFRCGRALLNLEAKRMSVQAKGLRGKQAS